MSETLENPSAEPMETEAPKAENAPAESNSDSKRPREGAADEPEKEDDNGDAAKKQKVEKSVEEQGLDKPDETEAVDGDTAKEESSGPVNVGPKKFGSSVEMYDYFYKLLHSWTPNININKYEHITLLELLKKGHLEPQKKIGTGIRAFQVRYHPQFKSRCFFLIREDESVDDFSFRKCVDHILPLPENMQIKQDVNKALGVGKGGGGSSGGGRGGGRGRGRGREGKSRN